MADFDPAAYDPYGQRPDIQPLPFAALPSMPGPQRNAIVAGLSSGIDDLQALGGRAIEGIGTLTGWDGLKSFGGDIARRNEAESQANGRTDLDTAPWREGGGGWSAALPWLGYQAGKQIPQLAATFAAGALVPEAVVPAMFGRAAGMLPKAITGAEAGLDAAGIVAKNAEFGKQFGRMAIGGMPESFGSLYQQAAQREEEGGDKATAGDAVQALGMSPFYSALDALEPAFLHGLAKKGATGNLLKRAATGGAAGALQEIPTEALQTAMENSFRPDMTPQQKMDNIVDAALTGGAVGGLFGGSLAAMRRVKSAAPAAVSNKNITDLVDQVTTGPEQGDLFGAQPQQEQQLGLFGNLPETAPQRGPTSELAAPAVAPGPEQLDLFGRPAAPQQLDLDLQRPGADDGLVGPPNAQQGPPVPLQPAQRTLALAAPAPAPKTISELFSQHSDDDVSNARAQLEADITARNGKTSQDEMQQLRLLRAEEARRQSGGADTQSAANGLFSENDFDQRMPRTDQQEAAAPANASQPMRDLAQQLAGRKVQWMTKLNAADEVDLAAHVQERLENGASDRATLAVAEKLGVTDKDGNPVDYPAAIAKAQQAATKAQTQTLTDPAARPVFEAAKAKLTDLQQKAKVLQDVQQRRAGGEAEQQSQQAVTTLAAAGTAPKIQQATLPMTFAPQTAPAPQTAGETREALKPVVGKMTPDLRALDAQSLPEAINAVVDHLATNPRPKQTFVKIAQEYGLYKGGKPVSVAKAVAGLQTQLAGVQSKIDKLTPQQAPRSRGLAEQAGAIQQKIDVLNAAQGAQETTTVNDDAAARLPGLRQQLQTIASDMTLAPQMRREATDGLQKIRSKSPDALNHAEALVAVHSATTGQDVLARRSAAPADFEQRAAEVNGRIVHSDGQNALVHAYDEDQNPIYYGVKREGANTIMTRGDINAYGGSMFTGREVQQLRDQARKLEDQERDRERARPDGPFTGATSNVVASPSVDPKMTGLLTDWMQHLGLGNVRVFFTTPGDVTEQNRDGLGIIGSFRKVMAVDAVDEGTAGNFGPNKSDFFISVTPTGNQRLDIDNLSHEFGHIIKWTTQAQADTQTKAALETDFQKFLMDTKGMTLAEVTRAARGAAAGAHFANQIPANLDENSPGARAQRAYLTSRDEWFADNVAKYLTTDKRAVGIVGKFFEKVASLISKVMDLVTKGFIDPAPHVQPAASVKAYLDGMIGKGNNAVAWNSFDPNQDYTAFRSQAGLNPQSVNENSGILGKIAEKVRDVAEKATNYTGSAQKVVLGWSTLGHIAEFYSKPMPETQKVADARAHLQTVATRVSQQFANAYEKMQSLPQAAQDRIQRLQILSGSGVDGRKLWKDHTWLHNEPNAKQLEGLVTEANKAYAEMGKMPGAQEAYGEMVAHNQTLQFAPHALSLYNLVNGNEALKSAIPMNDPITTFLENAKLRESTALTAAYFKEQLKTQAAAVTAYLNQQNADRAIAKASDKAKISVRISPLETAMLEIQKDINKDAQAPYFHMGRTGEYFVGFSMKGSAENPNVVDPKSRAAVEKYLIEKGFNNVSISDLSDKNKAFIRLETSSAGTNLMNALKELQAQGHVGSDIVKGLRNDPRIQNHMQSKELEAYINNIKATFTSKLGENEKENEQTQKALNAMVAIAREQWLDMLPDTAIAKVMTQRDMVPGFNKDMMQNFAKRSQIGSAQIANLSAQPRINDALSAMNSNVLAAQRDTTLSLKDVELRKNIYDEVSLREQQRSVNNPSNWVDAARAINHAYFLGFSPSYVFVNLTQPFTMLLPELGKKHGFVASARAMAKVTPLAFRIVGAQIAAGKALGLHRIGDGTLTDKALESLKLSPADRAFLTKLINTGTLELGSAGREQGQVAEGTTDTKLASALRMSSAFGLYSETLSRLIAGFSARELHGDTEGAVEYAAKTINQSMLNYSNWNVARQAGKNGFAGQVTPLGLSFMQYQMQVIEKLTREVHAGFLSSAVSGKEREEAQRFVAGHMAAMTVFAGTLGLPMVSIAARAAEKLADLWKDDKDEPWDAKAAYRNFVSGVVGKDLGEVIARGLPRALGIDISARAGEADIVPFSKFLTDKRKWDDRVKELATGTLGAPFSMAANLISMGGSFAHGDFIEGLKKGAPVALSNPAKAFDLAANGYSDSSKNQLPITPGAGDIISQLLGFNPAQKAEYTEANSIQRDRKGEMQRRSAEIRKDLAVAIEKGDTSGRDTLLERARDFDRANPGFQILPRMQATLQLRAKARAMADVTNEPLGVKPKDRAAVGLTDFANY